MTRTIQDTIDETRSAVQLSGQFNTPVADQQLIRDWADQLAEALRAGRPDESHAAAFQRGWQAGVTDAAAQLRAGRPAGDPEPHRCSGCGHRWEGDLKGAELCGDCWRTAQPVLHAGRPAADWQTRLKAVVIGWDSHDFDQFIEAIDAARVDLNLKRVPPAPAEAEPRDKS